MPLLKGLFGNITNGISNLVGGVVGSAAGGAATILNSQGGQILAQQATGLLATATGSTPQFTPNVIVPNTNSPTSKPVNPVKTGAGYDSDLTGNYFTIWKKVQNKRYVLSPEGYPQNDWTKIIGWSTLGLGIVVGLIALAMRKPKTKIRRASKKSRGGRTY